MRNIITIPFRLEKRLQEHLFQNELEQGAFLYANVNRSRNQLSLEVRDIYLIPKDGWQVQLEVYLEMKDSERAKIMSLARNTGNAVIDCHSHPDSYDDVQFSPSDIHGITDFAAYAKWKLDGKPFAAIVWGEQSLDAVIWLDSFKSAIPVDEIIIDGSKKYSYKPRGSWFFKETVPWQMRIYRGR